MKNKRLIAFAVFCMMLQEPSLMAASTVAGSVNSDDQIQLLIEYYAECTSKGLIPKEYANDIEEGGNWFQDQLKFDPEKKFPKQAVLEYAILKNAVNLTQHQTTRKKLLQVIVNYDAARFLMQNGISKAALTGVLEKFPDREGYDLYSDLKEEHFTNKKQKAKFKEILETQKSNWSLAIKWLNSVAPRADISSTVHLNPEVNAEQSALDNPEKEQGVSRWIEEIHCTYEPIPEMTLPKSREGSLDPKEPSQAREYTPSEIVIDREIISDDLQKNNLLILQFLNATVDQESRMRSAIDANYSDSIALMEAQFSAEISAKQLESTVATLTEQLKEAEQAKAKTEADLEKFKAAVESDLEALKAESKINKDQVDLIAKQQADLAEAHINVSDLKSQLQAAQQELAKTNDLIESIKVAHSTEMAKVLAQKAEELTKSVDALKAEQALALDALKAEVVAKEADHVKALDTLNAQLASSSKAKSDLESNIATLTEQLKAAKSEKTSIQAALDAFKTGQTGNKKAQAELIQKQQTDLANANKRISDLEIMRDAAQQDLAKANDANATLISEKEELTKTIDALKAAAAQKAEELTKAVESLNAEHATAIGKLNKDLEHSQSVEVMLTTQKEELNSALKKLREDHQSDMKTLSDDIQSKEKTINDLSQELIQAKVMLDASHSSAGADVQLRTQIQELEDKLAGEKVKMDVLIAERDTAIAAKTAAEANAEAERQAKAAAQANANALVGERDAAIAAKAAAEANAEAERQAKAAAEANANALVGERDTAIAAKTAVQVEATQVAQAKDEEIAQLKALLDQKDNAVQVAQRAVAQAEANANAERQAKEQAVQAKDAANRERDEARAQARSGDAGALRAEIERLQSALEKALDIINKRRI